MGSAAGESPDIDAMQYCFRFLSSCPIFKSEHSECEWGRKTGQNFALCDPCEKYGRTGGDVYRNYSCHTQVLSTDILYTWRRSAVWSHVGRLTEKELSIKRIASGSFANG